MTVARERLPDGSVRVKTMIINRLGLHARAAARFVETASRYSADVTVANGEECVSGKSILGLMMLAAAEGTTLVLTASGTDADAVLDALCELIAARFHEGA